MSRETSLATALSYLGKPLAWFSWLLIGFTLIDWLLNIFPLQLRGLAWRYASEGLFSSALPVLALGLLLYNLLALLEGSYRRMRRAINLEVGFAFLYLIFGVDFVLSAVQLRDTAVTDFSAQLVFDAGAVKVFAKYVATGAVQLLAALASWRWLRENPEPGTSHLSGPKRPWWLFWWPEPAPQRKSGRR